ncbi:MAG: hypothetical protein KGN76_17985 [Acidobacteriota bacterium]|nr:hypothetical protein [Acidobacteriota bacterium]
MSLRIAFDLDGVLADMQSALRREAETLFGSRPRVPEARPAPEGEDETVAEEPEGRVAAETEPSVQRLLLTARQRRRLWAHVEAIDGFWESLGELEPGSVSRLATIALERRWEVIFLTQRPETAGATAQVQSQRWLERHGFPLPSVFVVMGSRGRIAEALDLDLVVDDRAENCLEVAVDSRARPVLVWRDRSGPVPPDVTQLGVVVVDSVRQCLDSLQALPRAESRRSLFDRLKGLFSI